nr:hypothetical protein Itr_chr07CG09210 [Ipomoea trifida]
MRLQFPLFPLLLRSANLGLRIQPAACPTATSTSTAPPPATSTSVQPAPRLRDRDQHRPPAPLPHRDKLTSLLRDLPSADLH